MTIRSGRGAGVALALLAVLAFAGCAAGTTRSTFPPLGSTPQPAGGATDATKEGVIAALAAEGLPAGDAIRTYRPPEGPLLAAAPRSVLQVTLPDDPAHGYIVVYALPSAAAANAAARDHAAYISSGPGGIQFPAGTQFVLRVAGSNVVFFSWSPGNAPDARTATIAQVLGTVGTEVPVPG